MKSRMLLASKINTQYYIDAVNNLGAVADAKHLPEIDTSYDGLLLCGGGDTDPKYYGQEVNGAVDIENERMCFDGSREDTADGSKVIKAFIEKLKPLLKNAVAKSDEIEYNIYNYL